jgi:hypothetical protein
VNTNFKVPGGDIEIDLVAVMPRLRDLKTRFEKGFAPIGVLQHLMGRDWVDFKEITEKTGYNLGFIDCIVQDGVRDQWFEFRITEKGPQCRTKNYRIPAKICLMAFVGTEELNRKIEVFTSIKKEYTGGYFIFPYEVDSETKNCMGEIGAGIFRYYEKHGVFQEVLPAEILDIENQQLFALTAEKVLYDNVWIMMEEAF